MQIHLKLSPSPRPRPAYQLRLFRRTTATPHSVILLIVLQFRHQRLGQYHHLASNIHQSHLNTCCSLEVLSNDDDGERVRVSNYKSELCRVAAPITMVWRCRWLLASAGGGPHSSLSVTSQSAPRHRHTHTLSHTVTQCTTITLLPLLWSLRSEWVCRMWIYDHNGDCLQDWNYMTISLFLYSPKQI